MTPLEVKKNSCDSNWEQRVFNILGVIVECYDNDLEFYSAAGLFNERDFEIEENIYESYSSKNAEDFVAALYSSPRFEDCLQDMNLGSFTKYELFVHIIYNLLIPTVKATHNKYGKESEHLYFKNISYSDDHDIYIDGNFSKASCLVIQMAFAERDESFIDIKMPITMSLKETLEYIKRDLADTINSCDISIVLQLEDKDISIPRTYDEVAGFHEILNKWSLTYGDDLPD